MRTSHVGQICHMCDKWGLLEQGVEGVEWVAVWAGVELKVVSWGQGLDKYSSDGDEN